MRRSQGDVGLKPPFQPQGSRDVPRPAAALACPHCLRPSRLGRGPNTVRQDGQAGTLLVDFRNLPQSHRRLYKVCVASAQRRARGRELGLRPCGLAGRLVIPAVTAFPPITGHVHRCGRQLVFVFERNCSIFLKAVSLSYLQVAVA